MTVCLPAFVEFTYLAIYLAWFVTVAWLLHAVSQNRDMLPPRGRWGKGA